MKIAIVGGGTAGWLAALMLNKIQRIHQIVVIESSSIGIIGAGEGSTGLLTNIVRNDLEDFGCDYLEFFKETGAGLKYGIHHKDWREKGQSYFAPLAGSSTSSSPFDFVYAYALENDIDNKFLNKTGIAAENMVSTYNYLNFQHSNKITNALHFDAHKVGKYFQKICLKNPLVTLIDDTVISVNINESGDIKSLVLSKGSIIDADFFIDASGFSRVLTSALNIKWKSYKDNLPVNSAMPFFIDYESDEIPEPWTTAWAQSSGWMWQIPTRDRKGCGYVFCDEFITADQAHNEIEKTLGKKINPVRILKFDTGRLEKLWHKNCLAIGLCAAFAEPLEATSIHSTIVQLMTFIYEYLGHDKESTVGFGAINQYNRRMTKMYDEFKDFLNIHYMGGREDSEFWKHIKSGKTRTDFTNDIIDMCRYRIPSDKDFSKFVGGVDWGLYSYILRGTGILTKSVVTNYFNHIEKVSKSDINRNSAREQHEKYLKESNDALKNMMSYKNFINLIRK